MNWGEMLSRLEPETALRAAALWNADLGSLEFVSQSANAVYTFTVDGEIRFLRLVHFELRDHEFTAAGIDFLNHAWLSGAFVQQPLLSARSCFIEDVLQGEDVFLATVTAGVNGLPLGDQITATQLVAWGQALGTLHLASETYKPVPVRLSSGMVQFPESFSIFEFWQNVAKTCANDPDLGPAHIELGAWLKTLPKSEMIVTHNDLRPANAIWDGARVTILDFDEPTLAWAEYDVARAMLNDDVRPFPNLKMHLETFMRGYHRARGLPDVQNRIHHFVRVRVLLMLAWSLEDSSWAGDSQASLRHIIKYGLKFD